VNAYYYSINWQTYSEDQHYQKLTRHKIYPFKIMMMNVYHKSIKDTTELVLAVNKFRPKRDHSQCNPAF
jgi:hypothetical protein